MNKTLRVLLFLGALALIFSLFAMLGAWSGSRGELRQLLAELQAKGEKLTFAELSRDWHTNAIDTHAAITNAVLKLKTGSLNPVLLELEKPLRAGGSRVAWREPEPPWDRKLGSPTNGTWEHMEAQLAAAEPALQEIRLALKTPALHAGPCTNMWAVRRVNFVAIRVAAYWLTYALEDDLHRGRLEPALQNLEALLALALMERDEPMLVAQMIRIAVAGLAFTATWEALEAPGWTEPQLERLQKAWEAVDCLDALELGLIGERAGGYEMFCQQRSSRGARSSWLINGTPNAPTQPLSLKEMLGVYVLLPVYRVTSINQDELFYLRTMQQGLASVRLLKTGHPWPEAQQAANQSLSNITAIASSPWHYRYLFSMIALPNYSRAGERAAEMEVSRQMALAAVALKRYQLAHGRLPSSLQALVPEFLARVPRDYLGAKDLGYRLNADSRYLLYSVGKDGKDDGGDANPPPGNPVGLWTGWDAVWPAAAR